MIKLSYYYNHLERLGWVQVEEEVINFQVVYKKYTGWFIRFEAIKGDLYIVDGWSQPGSGEELEKLKIPTYHKDTEEELIKTIKSVVIENTTWLIDKYLKSEEKE